MTVEMTNRVYLNPLCWSLRSCGDNHRDMCLVPLMIEKLRNWEYPCWESEEENSFIWCHKLAVQVGASCVVRSGPKGHDRGDDWIPGSDIWDDTCIRVSPSSLKPACGMLCDLVIGMMRWVFGLTLGAENKCQVPVVLFSLWSHWSDDFIHSAKTHFWYFLQALSNAFQSWNCHDGKTCQLNHSWRAWLTAAWSWKSLEGK